MAGLIDTRPRALTQQQIEQQNAAAQISSFEKNRQETEATMARVRQEHAEKLAQQQLQSQAQVQTQTVTPSIAPMVQNTGGHIAPIRQDAYENQSQTTLQAQLARQAADEAARRQTEAENRRMALLSQSGLGSAPAQVSHGGVTGDEGAARAAHFARAKDQAGQTALASLKALTDVMAGSGRMGSSMEAQGIADVVGEGMGDINEFTREQLIQDLAREGEIADMNFQGRLTQRGQDMSMVPSILGMLSSSGTAY